jgi:hypothetical protein
LNLKGSSERVKRNVGSRKGLFGNYVPVVNGEVVGCRHFHRTPQGAERCAAETHRFLERVEKLKREREEC